MDKGYPTCRHHKNLTIIERVFVENVIYISEGDPPEERDDWYGDAVRWHDPQPMSITVTCSDCGFEQIYRPHVTLPKWVQAAFLKKHPKDWIALVSGEVNNEQ